MCVARWIVVYGAPAYITSSKEWTISAPSMLNLTAPRFSLSAASIDTFINPTVSSRSRAALPSSLAFSRSARFYPNPCPVVQGTVDLTLSILNKNQASKPIDNPKAAEIKHCGIPFSS
jgi:hypothetical protein